MKFFFFFLTFLAINCTGSDQIKDQDTEKKELEQMAKEIRVLAEASSCSDSFTCKYVAFGSKPCGGPWGYLVYSTSVDETELLKKVEDYNEKERKYNIKFGIISDCSFAMPPDKVICENGKCKAVY